MKKTIRIMALALALVMLCGMFVACGKTLSGTYSMEAGLGGLVGGSVSMTFSGSKVTITTTGTLLGSTSTAESKGTYEITEAEDGTMSINIALDDDADEDAKTYEGNFTFAEDKEAETISIGIFTFTKKK